MRDRRTTVSHSATNFPEPKAMRPPAVIPAACEYRLVEADTYELVAEGMTSFGEYREVGQRQSFATSETIYLQVSAMYGSP